MSNINIVPFEQKGTQCFLGKKIPVIYGGFGQKKKVVLVKTVAEIHGDEVKNINRLINNNLKRFKEGVDIIDIKKCGDLESPQLNQMGFTQMQISKANNIYLLSERGYAKLIKIMDNDLAWEIHEQLVDEYFLMKEEKENPYANLSIELQSILMLDKRTQGLLSKVSMVEDRVEQLENESYLASFELDQISKKVKSKAFEVVGGDKSPAYEGYYKRVISDIYRELRRNFEITSYKALRKGEKTLALEIIENYVAPIKLVEAIRTVNQQEKLFQE